MALIAVGAIGLALVGSFWLARLLTEPIDRLSTSLAQMTASHDVTTQLPLTGSSREVDALTRTFNGLMSSVAVAEAQTEAAYTGAIRALAAALDARDPYTAGHSDRVSVVSVAIDACSSCPRTSSKSCASVRGSTTSARSACPTRCCASPAR